MLRALSIRDVVLIDRLDLTFRPGLSVLTGETGAGKSILLDALGLALGARADSGLLRHGADQASVSAEFDLAPTHPALALLAGQGIDHGEGEGLALLVHNPTPFYITIARARLTINGKSWTTKVDMVAPMSNLRLPVKGLTQVPAAGPPICATSCLSTSIPTAHAPCPLARIQFRTPTTAAF